MAPAGGGCDSTSVARVETPTQVYAAHGYDVIEELLIQLWPATRNVEVRHKLTDQLGLPARTSHQPDPELVGSWPMLLNNQCRSFTLRIGVEEYEVLAWPAPYARTVAHRSGGTEGGPGP
ncbi:hypothetical protein [Streptomyces sp. RPT161]|uniref:hypothetical protein n=1 Tax=Streptomyces sp. RPT161 TaxID=3015993 RepID=UPI0022B88C74|nr:hypothetical protein [Streptomyces sp. RPT161]